MDKNRLWIIGAIAVMVAIVAAGWFLGIQPQLAVAAAADQDRASTQVQNAANETLLASLKKDYGNIGKLKTQLSSLRDSVPEGSKISAFVTELDSLAGAHQITVNSITVNDATPYAPPVSAATPAPGASATPTPTPTPTPSATPAPVAPTAPVGPLQVTNPKITAANFVAIPVQLSITGQYANVLDFVDGLQTGPRLFLVTSLSITSAKGGVESSIGGFVYVLLQSGTGATATPTAPTKP